MLMLELPLPLVQLPQFKPNGQWNLEAVMRIFGAGPGNIRLSTGEQFFPKTLVQQGFLQKIRIVVGWGGGFGLERKTEDKRRALAGRAFGFNLSAVMVDDEKAGDQMDAVFGRHAAMHDKGIEDDAQGFLRQARPVVADLNDDLRLAPPVCNSAASVIRLPAGSMASSSMSNNSNSRLNFGWSTRSAGSESGIRFSISIRRAAN